MNKNKPLKRLMALALSVAMVFTVGPVNAFAQDSQLHIGASGEITAFEPLADSVANQTVPLGTLSEDLDLPETLTATAEVETFEEQADNVRDSGAPAQEDLADTDTDTQDGGTAAEGTGDKEIPDADEAQTGTPSEAQQTDGEALLQIQSVTGSALALGNRDAAEDTGSTQQTVAVPVSEWLSNPDYDPKALGTYTFAPVLDEGWSLSAGVELPTVTVQVVMGIMPLASDPSSYTFDVGEGDIKIESGTNPNTLKVRYGDGQVADNIPEAEEITLTGTVDGHSGGSPIELKASCSVKLENLNITSSRTPIHITADPPVTVSIALSGTNTLCGTGGHSQHGFGLSGDHTVTIGGSGYLSATGYYGIDIGPNTQLVVTEDADVTARGQGEFGLNGYGIGTGNPFVDTCSLTISGDAQVRAEGTDQGIGGSSSFDVTLKDNAQVWATGNAKFLDASGEQLYILQTTVTDSTNAPVEGAQVQSGSHSTTTDENGRAYLYIPSGEEVALKISKDGYVTVQDTSFPKTSSLETKEISLTVEENGGGNSGAYSWMTVNDTQDTTTKVYYAGGAQDGTTYQWYVVGLDGTGVASAPGTITLFAADNKMGSDVFLHSSTSNVYETSNLRTQLTTAWRYTAHFKESEKSAMVARLLEGGSSNQGASGYDDNKVAGLNVTDKLWALSVNEANALNADLRTHTSHWWLRSPGGDDYFAAVVNDYGDVYAPGYFVSNTWAVRPAFQLNLDSVLFASAAAGGKSSATVGSGLTGASAPSGAVKFTVLDDAQALDILATTAQSTQSGDSLRFTYANATTGTNQYVSCVLEQDGEVKYYSKLVDSSSAASGDLNIPLSGVADGAYTLKIFSEQANGDKKTDFASTPISMTVNVSGNTGTVSDFGGTVDDTAPWGVDGIFDLSALPASDKTSTDQNTPWSWDSTAQTLTLTGPGPYTLTGTGTATIAANMSQDMEIILDDGHLTAPHSTVHNGRNALTVTGSNKLTITGNGSMAGGTGDFFGGRGIDASGSTGELIVSGNLDISGGSGQAGVDGILAGGNTTLSGEIKLTGGNGSSSGTAGNGFYGMPDVSLFLSGNVEATGGDSSATFIQSGRAVVADNIHFMDTSASLIAKNGLSMASSISLDLINDTANTRWDIAPSAITGGGTVNDPSITVDIPAYPDSVTIRLTTIQPGITTSPVNQAVTEGQMATFSVTATGIQLSYQWQVDKQDGFSFQNVTDGTGGNTAQYTTPMTDVSMSGYTYRVIVSNMGGDATSNPAVLTVNALVNAATPIITNQLQDAAYTQNATPSALSVTATVNDGGILSYQWYENTADSNSGGTAISGATAASYTPSTNTVGYLYYYCTVTNTNAAVSGNQTATITSNAVKVTVTISGGSGGSSSDGSYTSATTSGNIKVYGVNVPYTLNNNTHILSIDLTTAKLNEIIKAAGENKTIAINAGTRAGLKEVAVSFPPAWFAQHSDISFPVQSNIGGFMLSNNLAKQFPAQTQAATVSIQSGSLIFSAKQSGKAMTWKDANAPVGIYMPYTPPADINTNTIILYNKTNGVAVAHSFYSGGKVYAVVSGPGTYDANISAGSFTDTQDHWAIGDILFATGHGLISGTSATTFAPDTAITRADFLKALGKLSGADVSGCEKSSFNDVSNDSPTMPYIEWAVANKIVQGIGNNQFGPNQAITREQMAVMLTAYAKATGQTLPKVRTSSTFADSKDISTWAKDAVTAIQRANIIVGKIGNRFDPQDSATRAEASAILHRFAETAIHGEKGWVQTSEGQWMYIDSDYLPRKGWLAVANSDTRYYFDSNGNMVSGKWLQIEGKWYYFHADGSLARSTKIDEYEVDENGVRKTK